MSDSSLASLSSSSCETTRSLLEDTSSLLGLETSMSDSDDGALPVGVRGGVSSRCAPCFVSAKPMTLKGIRGKRQCNNTLNSLVIWVCTYNEFK